ncbi:MAG: hypothetical protein Q8L66_03415 [Caulobacter sp.]|nr:hypothetical protein [Caulobacter sp.]
MGNTEVFMDDAPPVSQQLKPAAEVRGWPVASALRAGMHLRARCLNPRCQRVTVVDAAWWAAGHGADDRLHMLGRRMRCSGCGAREAGIEVWSGPQPSAAGDGPFAFR